MIRKWELLLVVAVEIETVEVAIIIIRGIRKYPLENQIKYIFENKRHGRVFLRVHFRKTS